MPSVSAFARAMASCAPTLTLRARSSNRNGTNEALIDFLSSRAPATASRVARRPRDDVIVAERRALGHDERAFVATFGIRGEVPQRDFASAPRVAQRERHHHVPARLAVRGHLAT